MERNICCATTRYESDSKKNKSNLFTISIFILLMIIYAFLGTKLLIVETPREDKAQKVSASTLTAASNRYF